MGAVDIGIGHNDDLMISELGLIEFISDSCAECSNNRLKFLVGIHLIDTCLLYIKHLTPKRKDRLVLSLTTLLSGTAGGISLNDEYLTELCFIRLTISKLTGKLYGIKSCLSSCCFSGVLCCCTCSAGRKALLHDYLGDLGILLEICGKLIGNCILNHGSDLGISELRLRLSFELRFRKLN